MRKFFRSSGEMDFLVLEGTNFVDNTQIRSENIKIWTHKNITGEGWQEEEIF